VRLYVQEAAGGPPRPFTDEGQRVFWDAVSPDGSQAVALSPDAGLVLHPVAGGAAAPVPGQLPGDQPVRWSADGRVLYVVRRFSTPQQLVRLHLNDGRREPVRELAPFDPAGVTAVWSALVTPDGRSYAYTYGRVLSDLYLVEGLG
jgi:hypothetical protein